jgi:hypothetical protein
VPRPLTPLPRVLSVLLLVAHLALAQAQVTALYNLNGEATAFIDWAEEATIYHWDGRPLAYLYDDGSPSHWLVYSFPGVFLGWFEGEAIWDQQGNAILASASVLTSVLPRQPLLGLKRLRPLKGIRGLAPLKPLYSYRFSSRSAEAFFGIAAATPTPRPITPATSGNRGAYPGIDRTQTIQDVSRNGDVITLLDGSRWEVYSLDRWRSSLLIPFTRVLVTRAARPTLGHDYLIDNQRGQELRVRFLGY